MTLQDRAGLARRATYFGVRLTSLREVSGPPLREHLLAQMKVGKAKSLNTIWPDTKVAPAFARQCRAAAMPHCPPRDGNETCASVIHKPQVFPAKRLSQIVFRPFALVTFIWASK